MPRISTILKAAGGLALAAFVSVQAAVTGPSAGAAVTSSPRETVCYTVTVEHSSNGTTDRITGGCDVTPHYTPTSAQLRNDLRPLVVPSWLRVGKPTFVRMDGRKVPCVVVYGKPKRGQKDHGTSALICANGFASTS